LWCSFPFCLSPIEAIPLASKSSSLRSEGPLFHPVVQEKHGSMLPSEMVISARIGPGSWRARPAGFGKSALERANGADDCSPADQEVMALPRGASTRTSQASNGQFILNRQLDGAGFHLVQALPDDADGLEDLVHAHNDAAQTSRLRR